MRLEAVFNGGRHEMNLGERSVLILIDMQKAIDDPSWGTRNNPALESNVARLLGRWRELGWPVCHVHHMSVEARSTFRPGQPGCEAKPETAPHVGEWVLIKRTASAFIGTDLEYRLRIAGWHTLVITGVITNNSVEATARMAGGLGFCAYVVSDATATFGRRDWNGKLWSAEDVHALSLANLSGEYATVTDTNSVLEATGCNP